MKTYNDYTTLAIYCTDIDDSIKVQKCLFSYGYIWSGGSLYTKNFEHMYIIIYPKRDRMKRIFIAYEVDSPIKVLTAHEFITNLLFNNI